MKAALALIGLGLCSAIAATGAQAQGYPARDITLLVPHAPGASTDAVARTYATELEKVLSANVNVENKPGGSGTIMTGQLVGARPDGHTIGIGMNSALGYQPLVNSSLKYRTPDDYQPIIKLVDIPTVLAVRADAPWKDFEAFMAEVKQNPGKVRASVSGLGGTPDLVVKQLNGVAGTRIVTVPFTGGGGEAVVALLGGRVEAHAGTSAGVIGHVQAGKLRVLAVFKKGRYDVFPEATPVLDAGYDAPLASSFYVIAPKDLPAPVKEKLVAASQQVVKGEAFRAFASKNGYVVDPKGPEESKADLEQQIKSFAELVKSINAK